MERIGDQVKVLATSAGGSLQKHETLSVQRALSERMTLSEAIEAATRIVDAYPNGGRDAGKGYLGALASMLASYPKSVAVRCADRVNGIVRACKFLPTPADVVAWCEHETQPLRRDGDYELRVERQLKQRAEFEAPRTERLSYAELKAKYGDGEGGWGIDRDKPQPKWLTAEQLAAMIGQDEFDKIPNQPRREPAQ